MKTKNSENARPPQFFTTPEEAVLIITDLLKKEDFKTLAAYYDLSDSKIKRVDLESGEFFIRKKRPEVAHPAGFWRYKHPFAPGFKFNNVLPTDRKGVYVVEVIVIIDQGADFPKQVGASDFYMIESAKGWQVLPDRPENVEHSPADILKN